MRVLATLACAAAVAIQPALFLPAALVAGALWTRRRAARRIASAECDAIFGERP